jgi:hypothetical protein
MMRTECSWMDDWRDRSQRGNFHALLWEYLWQNIRRPRNEETEYDRRREKREDSMKRAEFDVKKRVWRNGNKKSVESLTGIVYLQANWRVALRLSIVWWAPYELHQHWTTRLSETTEAEAADVDEYSGYLRRTSSCSSIFLYSMRSDVCVEETKFLDVASKKEKSDRGQFSWVESRIRRKTNKEEAVDPTSKKRRWIPRAEEKKHEKWVKIRKRGSISETYMPDPITRVYVVATWVFPVDRSFICFTGRIKTKDTEQERKQEGVTDGFSRKPTHSTFSLCEMYPMLLHVIDIFVFQIYSLGML